MEKLKKIYEFYKKIAKEYKISFELTDFHNSYSAITLQGSEHDKIRSCFYKCIVDAFGFNKLPQIVSAKDYKSLNKIELYHGYRFYNHGVIYLKDKDVFDYGWIPSGFYVSANKLFSYYNTAKSGDEFKDSAKRILALKLNTDKICHFSYIKEIRDKIHAGNFDNFPEKDREKIWELINFVLTIEDEKERINFVECIMENYSNLAIILGYDAMYGGFAGYDEDDELHPEEIEVFNRGIVTVKQSKYDWFCQKAEVENSNELK